MTGRLTGWFGYPEYDEPSSSIGATFSGSPAAPRRVSILSPKNFDDTQGLADSFKRRQFVILNLRHVDGRLSKRVVDFCAGLTYALGGRVQPVTDRLFLLVPHDVEVSDEEGGWLTERAFFNQL